MQEQKSVDTFDWVLLLFRFIFMNLVIWPFTEGEKTERKTQGKNRIDTFATFS